MIITTATITEHKPATGPTVYRVEIREAGKPTILSDDPFTNRSEAEDYARRASGPQSV